MDNFVLEGTEMFRLPQWLIAVFSRSEWARNLRAHKEIEETKKLIASLDESAIARSANGVTWQS